MADKSFWSDKKDKIWLKNFWYYYKIHVIVAILVIVVVAFSVRDCMLRVDPDISVDCIGSIFLKDSETNNFKEYFQPLIKDIDEKNGNVISFVQHTLQDTKDDGDPQMKMAIQQSIMIEMTVGESYLYILDDNQFKTFNESGILLDLSTVSSKIEKGTYSIDLQNNTLFNKLIGKTNESVHLCIRSVTPSVKKKEIPKAQLKQQNAIIIFNEFYKNQ